jgi:hypothetical protein
VAGYSKRTLIEKLGIKPDLRVTVFGAPPGYPSLLGELPAGATLHSRLPQKAQFIHQFVRTRDELAQRLQSLAATLVDDGMLWISWPKQSSGVPTDLNENIIRELGLQHGLVDVKVCAIDDVWSGLKFVRRVIHRAPKSR